MSKNVEFNIKARMPEQFVNDFCSMLKWMQVCGNLGHSSVVAFCADGNGDFRPKFEIDYPFEESKEFWCKGYDRKPPEIEVMFGEFERTANNHDGQRNYQEGGAFCR